MYSFLGMHFKRWLWFIWPLAFILRIKIFPKSVTAENFQKRVENKSVVYVLPRMSILDIFVVNRALKKLKQPKIKTEAKPKTFWKNAILALKSPGFFFRHDDKEIFVQNILELLKSDAKNENRNFLFFPVSVYWTRAAERDEKGFLWRSLFPDDGTANVFQKLLILLVHRGEVNVSFGKEIEIYLPKSEKKNESSNEKKLTENLDLLFARRLRRQFYIEFAKERTSFLGPVLYDQDKITNWILSSDQTKSFLMHSEHPEKTQKQITKYIQEIAANYHYATLRAAEQIFDFIWTKVFTGIRIRNYEKIERLIKENCVIWMSCHRSHFDYLLLNYLLFKQGSMVPHVAAGINMNFWPIGPFIRHGGAFFIRRSFSGNKTYTHTFSEYVNFLLHNSYPIEFFPEGGRSRIGKLLPPKLGMLSICLQSVMQRKAENTYLMPVYIGYDKVMEDNTYAKELRGSKKQKENVFQFLNGIRKVFANYGSVDVSFGTPVLIATAWQEYIKKFEDETGQPFSPQQFKDVPSDIDTRDPKIQSFVKYLAYRVHQKINGAATASCTAILSTVLYTDQTSEMEEHVLNVRMMLLHHTVTALGKQLNWLIATARSVDHVIDLTTLAPNLILCEEHIQMGKRWGLLSEHKNNGQTVCVKNLDKELNLAWYRGTTHHIFAIVGVLAQALISCERFQISSLEVVFDTIRKLWRDELFWDEEASNRQLIDAGLQILAQFNVLTFDGKEIQFDKKQIEPLTSNVFTRKNILPFFANTIRPETEIYGLFMGVGLFLVEKKRIFERNELLEKAFSVHELAYKQNATLHSSANLKIYGNSVFDALCRQNIFKITERNRFSVDMLAMSRLFDFFDVQKWKKWV